MLFVSQLRCLDDQKGPHYSQYVHLLQVIDTYVCLYVIAHYLRACVLLFLFTQNLSKFNTFLVRTDDGVATVLIDLCTTLFDIIRCIHMHMWSIMCLLRMYSTYVCILYIAFFLFVKLFNTRLGISCFQIDQ